MDLVRAVEHALEYDLKAEVRERLALEAAGRNPHAWIHDNALEAAPSADRGEARDGWRPIETAPYAQEVEVQAGMMRFRAELVQDGSLDEDGRSCDQWRATREGEHPPCWSGGSCWESNEDLSTSLQPTAWRIPTPTTPRQEQTP